MATGEMYNIKCDAPRLQTTKLPRVSCLQVGLPGVIAGWGQPLKSFLDAPAMHECACCRAAVVVPFAFCMLLLFLLPRLVLINSDVPGTGAAGEGQLEQWCQG